MTTTTDTHSSPTGPDAQEALPLHSTDGRVPEFVSADLDALRAALAFAGNAGILEADLGDAVPHLSDWNLRRRLNTLRRRGEAILDDGDGTGAPCWYAVGATPAARPAPPEAEASAARLDALTAKLTGFPDFDHLLRGSHQPAPHETSYRPSFYTLGSADTKTLADAYDAAQAARGDTRRAYRGS
jgi:hypothetical protein